jgi:epoxyqueuosine reductase
MSSPEAKVKALASRIGFELCGIASLAAPPPSLQHYQAWLDKGYAGEMAYLERQKEKRLNPELILPGARSMISLGLLYNTDKPYSTESPGQPWVSRYAWGRDYHEVMGAMLKDFEAALREAFGSSFESKSYVDTGPISEKAWAAAAGLGWVGKNTNLINKEKGSWFFLGEILINLDLKPDQPVEDLCGNCNKCLQACPTQAFTAPYELDARRCLSYLSIEKRGEIAEEFEKAMGLNLYGCDICQDVCPWNHWKITGNTEAFEARPQNWNPDPAALANISDEDFSRLYNGSSMKRSKAEGLRRNAKIVLRNLERGNPEG